MKTSSLFFILVYFYTVQCVAVTTIMTTGKQKPDDASHDYFIGLLKLALMETSNEYGNAVIQTVPHPGQERVIKLLAMGEFYDVAWTGTSNARDIKLHKVPFPLFKGGLGWRGMIIRRDTQDEYASVKSIDDLKNYVICQGSHWPDADILEHNDLTVYRAGHFDAMLQMVVLKRCDLLPLSIFEGQAELALVQNSFPELMFYQELIIRYPLTMHFFVNLKKKKLAQRINLGLEKLENSGQLERYMQRHSLTKNAFPLSKFKKAQVIELQSTEIVSKDTIKHTLKWPKQN
ncbi:substrate-binding periplasmic protein [Litorilituus lipolyticus]|uniref:Transporter substrate-binding domain-containing protein n=1 Tax=Litorilituus lipolyticus TaxID=2491017 RepID=A0A502KMT1_9GAMM|nr:amino acid ABC transporter substrate-binding protein [Litorilituus lipolyticus]TPH12912.1 hypothetical protein EPA86_16010 [Litorilituus lipolyticus]